MAPQHKPQLPKKGRTPTHRITLNIPADLYRRMIEEAGIKWGELTPYIIRAIEEKMDRDKSVHTA